MEPSSVTEEELQIIAKHRLNSEAEKKAREYWERVCDERNQIDYLTPEELIGDIQAFCEEDGKPFIIDDDNRDVFNLLAWYFTRDPRFEERGYTFKKGIYLFGGVGLGKSHMMNLFRAANQRQAFRMVDCSDIAAAFIKKEKGGEESLEKYFRDSQLNYEHKWKLKTSGFCFDDFGIENEGKYFGNNVNCMERIIEVRYRSKDPLITHVVSNLNADMVEQRYGLRIRERMREMFNVINFPPTAKSRRK